MGPVGLVGIILSLAALPFATARSARSRTLLFFALLIAHLASSAAYYTYVQTASADSSLYYFDSYYLRNWDFGFGTVFTVKLVQALKAFFGGSYFDYFLLFQTLGFWGIVILMRIFDETHVELGIAPTWASAALLFLPGVHFWTSAIGKDAPLFFAASLAVWSAMRLSHRGPLFALALAIMVLFRPHVALVAAIALATAALFDRHSSPLAKLALLATAAIGLFIIVGPVRTTLNVDVTSAGSLGAFFEHQSGVAEKIGGTTTILNASFPVKLLSLLFRPLFVDANGVFALIASFENLVFLFVFGFLLFHVRTTLHIAGTVFFLRFALIFAALLTMLLAMVFYNVGLGVRQKMMIVPALFSFFVAQWTVYQAHARERREWIAVRKAELEAAGESPAQQQPVNFA